MKSEIVLNLKQSIYLPIKYSFIALYHPKRKGVERLTHCTVGTKLQFEKKKKTPKTKPNKQKIQKYNICKKGRNETLCPCFSDLKPRVGASAFFLSQWSVFKIFRGSDYQISFFIVFPLWSSLLYSLMFLMDTHMLHVAHRFNISI